MANEEINKLNELLNTYDDTILDLVHAHTKNHNEDVRNKRINGHPDTQAFIDRAHALLLAAKRKGELHFVERHNSSPRIFYATQTHLFSLQEDLVSPIKFGPFAEKITSITFHSYISGDGKKLEFILSVLDNVFRSEQEISSKANTQSNFTSDKKTYSQLVIGDNQYKLHSEGINADRITVNTASKQITVHHEYSEFNLPNPLESKNGIYPRMVLDETKSIMYVSDPNKRLFYAVNTALKNAKAETFSLPGIDSPLGIAIDNSHRLLLIRNHSDQCIYAYQMDQKQSFPVFQKFEHAIEIPRLALQNGREFTINCWLKRSGIRDAKWAEDFKRGLIGFYIEEGDKEFVFYYSVNGSRKIAKVRYHFPSNWFHLSIVKQENFFCVYVNGNLVSRQPAPAMIDTSLRLAYSQEPILFCVPGYAASELSVWSTAQTEKGISDAQLSWSTNQPDNLTGYWRLAVSNGEQLWTEKQTEFTDLSGHANHATTKNGRWQLDASPLPRLMKLYKTNGSPSFINQAFSIDNPAHHIYWIEKTDTGLNRIMRGSSLGHTRPIVFKETKEQIVDIYVQSGENPPFEELARAHRDRRDAFLRAIEQVSHQTEKGHTKIVQLHDTIVESHQQAADHAERTPNQRAERTDNQARYVQQITAMHNLEKVQQRELADKRIEANEEARRMVSEAHLEASRIRRETGEKLLEQRRKSSN